MDEKQEMLQTSETGNQRTSEARNQRSLVTHAVLVGLTPLIPVPVLDDLVKGYFRKRMVRALAASNGRSLSEEDVSALVSEKEGGCLRGCLLAVIVYPLKAIFRKIFFFLEVKRAVDLTSRTYHYGYLVNYSMQRRDDGKSLLDMRRAAELSEAIQTVCLEAPIKPVESAIGGTFRQSHRVLRSAANLLATSLRRVAGRDRAAQVAEAIEQVGPEEERELEPVVARMQRSIAAVPEEHFKRLRTQLDARLGLSSERA